MFSYVCIWANKKIIIAKKVMKSKDKISTVQRTIIEIKIHKTISFRVGCFRCLKKKKKKWECLDTLWQQRSVKLLINVINIFILHIRNSLCQFLCKITCQILYGIYKCNVSIIIPIIYNVSEYWNYQKEKFNYSM